MALPGETIATGANPTCGDCRVTPELEILRSGAGLYIGTRCHCGPYSRESGYYATHEEALVALRSGYFGRGERAELGAGPAPTHALEVEEIDPLDELADDERQDPPSPDPEVCGGCGAYTHLEPWGVCSQCVS